MTETALPISDKDMSKALKLLYNTWFRKWRYEVNEQRWQEAAEEGYEIIRDFDQYPVVWNLFISLLYELDARVHGGYTEITRDKILSVIKGERYAKAE